MTDDERKCAFLGHLPGPWINYPITGNASIPWTPPADVVPVYEPIRYISKRHCQRCGAVDFDRSNA